MLISLIEDSSSAGSISEYKCKELVEVTAEDIATHTGEGLKDAHHLAGCKIQPSFANDPNFLFSSVSDAKLSVEQ